MNRSTTMQDFLGAAPDPRVDLSGLGAIKLAASATAIGIALLVLLGWKYDFGLLKSVHPALTTMKANSAVAFILAGIALACQPADGRAWRRYTAAACSATVALIGALTLAEDVLGRDLGIDQFLFREIPPGAGAPGRMGANNAVAFLLLGVALFLTSWRGRMHWLTQALVLTAGFVALIALIGYVYSVASLYRLMSYTGMALHSAVLFLVLVGGCLCIHPEQGVVARLQSPGPGGHSIRRLLPLSALLLFGFGGLVSLLERRQLLPTQLEVAALAVGSFVVLAGLIYWNAGWLDRADGERQQAEDARRRSDARYRALIEAASQVIWTTDASGMVVDESPSWSRFTGQQGNAWRGWGWLDALHPDDRAEIAASWTDAVLRRAAFHCEYRVRTASGEYRHTEARAVPIFAPDGEVEEWVGMNIDISARKESEAALKQSEERERTRAEELETIMQAAPAALWIAHDAHCRSVESNAEAHLLMRQAPADAMAGEGAGLSHVEYRDGKPVAHDDLPLQAAARGVDVRGSELSLAFADGEVRYLFGNAVPLRNRDGSVRGAVAAFIDVSERRRAEEALRTADQRKDEILAMLAHELRNPLAAISNSIEILRRLGPSEARLQRPLAIIDSQSQHLARLVDDLLDVARIKQGKLILRQQRVELSEVVKRAIETIRPLIDSRQQHLTVHLAPQPLWVDGDAMRLAQVIANLLDNAAKYSEPGNQIVITTESNDGSALVRVRDRGVGIAPTLLPHVFDMFTQAERSLAHAPGGLGIGLALVRSLVEMHGGSVEAASEGMGKGSEFVVRLPVAAAAARSADERKPSNGTQPAAAWRILVIDDNIDSAQSLALLLRMEGHQTEFAYSGETAIALARAFKPQLMLVDIGLPDMDGFELARRLRTMPETAATLLVALTGYSRPEDRQRALEAGFDHHLVKPVDWEALRSLIASLVVAPARRASSS